jgi:hypothetical protein
MSERIDEFCENLRVKLTSMDDKLQALKAKIDAKSKAAEQDVRAQLDSLTRRMEQDRLKVSSAQNEVKKWVEERKAATKEKIAEWKTKHEKLRLQNRADGAERYAAAAAMVALSAVDEAQQAALEAWLARKDADSTQGTS